MSPWLCQKHDACTAAVHMIPAPGKCGSGVVPAGHRTVHRTMLHKPWKLTSRDMGAYRETFETVDYAKGGSQLKGNVGYAQPKLEAIRALAKRAASLDPNWMLQLDYTAIRSQF